MYAHQYYYICAYILFVLMHISIVSLFVIFGGQKINFLFFLFLKVQLASAVLPESHWYSQFLFVFHCNPTHFFWNGYISVVNLCVNVLFVHLYLYMPHHLFICTQTVPKSVVITNI